MLPFHLQSSEKMLKISSTNLVISYLEFRGAQSSDILFLSEKFRRGRFFTRAVGCLPKWLLLHWDLNHFYWWWKQNSSFPMNHNGIWGKEPSQGEFEGTIFKQAIWGHPDWGVDCCPCRGLRIDIRNSQLEKYIAFFLVAMRDFRVTQWETTIAGNPVVRWHLKQSEKVSPLPFLAFFFPMI